MSLTAVISNISRGSLHDGTGVRTVVYFKGCGLSCKWCHNPETLSADVSIMYNSNKCICCGRCIKVCPEHHKPSESCAVFLRDNCQKCGRCADACPSGALSLCGKRMNTDEVFAEIKKDIHFFSQSGGGVTLSGGECLLYPDFSAELFEKCKKEDINTGIETALFIPYKNVQGLLPFTDFIFADFKIADAEKHKYYTGQSNEQIIENLRRLSHEFDNLTIRIPLIPGVNDSDDDMAAFGRIITTFGNGIKGIELLKYNYLAKSKYQSAGIEYTSFGGESQSDDEMNEKCSYLHTALSHKFDVYWK